MKTFTLAAMLSGLSLLAAQPAAAQTIAPKSCAAEWPSAKALRDIGLPELSDDQLLALTRLLDRQASPSAVPQVIESRIDGDFDGWEGQTIFKLENGQIWQQSASGAKYHFANHPQVRISGSPATLHVEGFAPTVAVRRIK